jgi:hypothetical protein
MGDFLPVHVMDEVLMEGVPADLSISGYIEIGRTIVAVCKPPPSLGHSHTHQKILAAAAVAGTIGRTRQMSHSDITGSSAAGSGSRCTLLRPLYNNSRNGNKSWAIFRREANRLTSDRRQSSRLGGTEGRLTEMNEGRLPLTPCCVGSQNLSTCLLALGTNPSRHQQVRRGSTHPAQPLICSVKPERELGDPLGSRGRRLAIAAATVNGSVNDKEQERSEFWYVRWHKNRWERISAHLHICNCNAATKSRRYKKKQKTPSDWNGSRMFLQKRYWHNKITA